MIKVSRVSPEELVSRLGIAADHSLLQRTGRFYVVGDERDEFLILGLIPLTTLSNKLYLCAHMLMEPSRGQLRALKRFFISETALMEEVILAEATGRTACRFLEFFGLKPLKELNDRILYERAV